MSWAALRRLPEVAVRPAAAAAAALLGLVRYAMLCALVLAGLLALRLAVRGRRESAAAGYSTLRMVSRSE